QTMHCRPRTSTPSRRRRRRKTIPGRRRGDTAVLHRPESLPVNEQQDDRAQSRDDKPGRLTRLIPADRAADESAEHGANDPDQHRDEDASRITSGNDQLRNHTNDEPEEHPTQHPNHGMPPSQFLLPSAGCQRTSGVAGWLRLSTTASFPSAGLVPRSAAEVHMPVIWTLAPSGSFTWNPNSTFSRGVSPMPCSSLVTASRLKFSTPIAKWSMDPAGGSTRRETRILPPMPRREILFGLSSLMTDRPNTRL